MVLARHLSPSLHWDGCHSANCMLESDRLLQSFLGLLLHRCSFLARQLRCLKLHLRCCCYILGLNHAEEAMTTQGEYKIGPTISGLTFEILMKKLAARQQPAKAAPPNASPPPFQ